MRTTTSVSTSMKKAIIALRSQYSRRTKYREKFPTTSMAEFRYLVHFEDESGDRFFANGDSPDPAIGGQIAAYRSFDDLRERKDAVNTAIAKVLKLPHS